jgi:hypothetical protein
VKKLLLLMLTLAGMLGLSSGLLAQETKPLVVVTFSGYDELMKDLEYIGQLSGKPEMAKTVEGLLGFFTQGQGLNGLDKARPWGAVVATDGTNFPKAVFLPVSDADKLMASLVAFIGVPKDAGEGIWQIEVQANQMPLFVKAEGGWARIGQQPEDLKLLPQDPAALLGGLEKQYDIAVRALMKNIPEELRQLGLGFLQQGIEGGLQPMENEDEESFQQRKKLAQTQVDALVEQFNDLDHFTIGWSIDRPAKKTYFDFSMSAVPGSKTANNLAQLKHLTSQYGGFFDPKAMLAVSSASKFPPEEARQGREQLDVMRAQVVKELEKSEEFPNEEAKAAVTSLVGDLFDLVNGMLESGKTDLAASVRGSGPFTLVFGGHVGEGANLPQLVEKIAGVLKIEGALAGFEKDFAQQEGISFHKIAIKAPGGEQAEKTAKLLGPGDIQLIIGTGKDRLYLGAGADALQGLQTAIQQSKASAAAPVLPMNLTLSMAAVMKAAAYVDDTNPALALLGGMLEQSGNDKVQLTYQPTENGITARLEAQEGVIQVFGTLGANRQGNNPGF